ncbi:2323_t:CDS:1, partial [Racocetra persica]
YVALIGKQGKNSLFSKKLSKCISTIKLAYTEACVNESLRLISTVLYTLRCVIDDGNACDFN